MDKKYEFYLTPNGDILVDELGVGLRPFEERDNEMVRFVNERIRTLFPEAFEALCKEYETYSANKWHYEFLIASRFIRCNFGKFDGLTYDIDGLAMHVEDVPCPQRKECRMNGTICKPKPFGLTEREAMIARMTSEGMTYKEISAKLGIEHSTIKNFLQNIKQKLKLQSSKDITKLFVIAM